MDYLIFYLASWYSSSVFTAQIFALSILPAIMFFTASIEDSIEWSILLYLCWPFLPTQYKFFILSKNNLTFPNLLYVPKYAGYAFFTLITVASDTLPSPMIQHDCISCLARLIKSLSGMLHRWSPSWQKYSNPIHVFLLSETIYGLQLLNI